MSDGFGYDPRKAFGDVDLIARLRKGRKKEKDPGKEACPECFGAASLVDAITGQHKGCPTCKGKGRVK